MNLYSALYIFISEVLRYGKSISELGPRPNTKALLEYVVHTHQWRRQLWGTGARARLDVQQFHCKITFGINLTASNPRIV